MFKFLDIVSVCFPANIHHDYNGIIITMRSESLVKPTIQI